MAETINFKYGSLIRTGPQLVNGGKWDAELNDDVCNAATNADLTISIAIYFQQINPRHGNNLYADSDTGEKDKQTGIVGPMRRIQAWQPGEFHRFTSNLLRGAQNFWNGVFWLKTPATYSGLNWPDTNPKVRSNLYCKFELTRAHSVSDSHYTIAAVRVADDETFRSNSVLYSQKDIESENMIDNSTTKFWTHYHEVGHLLGLGHVGWKGHHNLHADNTAQAYGVSLHQMQDVMGRGSVVHQWHALPWQEAAATFTDTAPTDWEVHLRNHIPPTPLAFR